jgi:hypothetical protein
VECGAWRRMRMVHGVARAMAMCMVHGCAELRRAGARAWGVCPACRGPVWRRCRAACGWIVFGGQDSDQGNQQHAERPHPAPQTPDTTHRTPPPKLSTQITSPMPARHRQLRVVDGVSTALLHSARPTSPNTF